MEEAVREAILYRVGIDRLSEFLIEYELTMQRLLSVTVLFLSIAFLSGCETIQNLLRQRDAQAASVEAVWWEGPRVRPGVALSIQIGTPATQPRKCDVLVDQNGAITLGYLVQDAIKCDGMTLDELKARLIKEYSVYYRQPQVTVTFAPYDGKGVSPWGTVTVLGEVASPGPVNIPSTMELTVTKVLQMAGGVKPFADRSAIQVSRCDKDGKITRTIVDLKEIGKDGRVDKDMALRAGDVVWVPETWY